MKTEFFQQQLIRLRNRYTPKHVDQEFVKLLWLEIRDLPDHDAKIVIDVMIGEFNVDYPPKISHARELAVQRRKIVHQRQAEEASKNCKVQVKPREWPDKGLPNTLEQLGVKSLLEAIRKKPQGTP